MPSPCVRVGSESESIHCHLSTKLSHVGLSHVGDELFASDNSVGSIDGSVVGIDDSVVGIDNSVVGIDGAVVGIDDAVIGIDNSVLSIAEVDTAGAIAS